MPVEKQYSPEFRVVIDGVELPKPLRGSVTSVTFTTGLDGADRVDLVVANQGLKWLEHDQFQVPKPDTYKPFTLALGYLPDGLVPVFAGELTGVAASFPSSGVPQLTVTAQDRRHRMKDGVQARWHAIPVGQDHAPKPDALTADAVAGRYGLRVQTDPTGAKLAQVIGAAVGVAVAADPHTGQKSVRRQVNESDDVFLRRVAKENGLEVLIDHAAGGTVLRLFSPLDHLTPEVDLEYQLSLIEFTPRESNVGQVTKVATNIWVPAVKTRFGVTLGLSDNPPGLSLAVSPNPASPDDPKSVVVIDEPLTPATAPRRLVGELMPRLNERLTGSGSTIGDPRIRAGTVVRLGGLGVRFGGLYRVKSATHTLDGGGYRTRFEVRKEVWLEGVPGVLSKAVPVRRPPAIKVSK